MEPTLDEKIKRAHEITEKNIADIIKRAGYDFHMKVHKGDKPDSDSYEAFTIIWDDGTITSDWKNLNHPNHFLNHRNDWYPPITEKHYWTGSLMATLASDGISTDFKLPYQLLDKRTRRYTCMPLPREDCMRIRMAMMDYELFVFKLRAEAAEDKKRERAMKRKQKQRG